MISVTDILVTPRHFFGELCKKETDLKIPVLIILIIAFIGGISAYVVTGKTMTMMPSGMEGAAFIVSLIGFSAALIMTFIIWIIWAVAIMIMVYILKGKPSFTRLLEIVGYGFIPQIFGSIISMGIMITSLPDLVLPATSNMQEIEAAMKAFTNSPAMMAAMFIGVIFTLWSAYIWTFGVKESSKLELKKAAICVAVPLVIYILLTTSSLFM
ncbi:MAG: YIP1 family protein [Methanomicrobiaceae archaeon]|nr:YIP1 family protein [Methanomicrobiaceae archaeon]